ncbi:MAG: hypothetical protein QJT81_05120 [Candidatus Thiothrix putei]|uniref:Uncharacterized protein n=1 Tax=Candidatus Thiothrix putei TaxID=3080811 RepID=A0AA95KNU1_9GAMM|nr:MAG: hypothetical protein QJT81_05120 [Candidatus Thiothrix putei]
MMATEKGQSEKPDKSVAKPADNSSETTIELAKTVLMDLSQLLGKRGDDKILPVTLTPPSFETDYAKRLWKVIKERNEAIAFKPYSDFVDAMLCPPNQHSMAQAQQRQHPVKVSLEGGNAYELLKVATDCFLKQETGMVEDDNNNLICQHSDALNHISSEELEKLREQYVLNVEDSGKLPLPYLQLIREKLTEIPVKTADALAIGSIDDICYGLSPLKATCPTMIELIWSYWMEESLLIQTMNAITRRFQNVRSGVRDPLARMDIDPLRPMNNLLWGFIQDEPARLSLVRRAYEYDHHYGFSLVGKAVPKARTADSRSRFLGAFHQLLNLAHRFFRAYDDMTIKADAFPLLNALREVHLILAEGAHNQYGDLPWVARKEMLMMQWMLARPEMREFIGGRIMVPQKERWMDRVDGMKRLQGWSGTATTHFVDLAQTGERLLLSIRFASWSQIEKSDVALSWAVFWRDDIQRYAHAYRAVTGVDLTDPVTQAALDAKPPSYWLLQREAS